MGCIIQISPHLEVSYNTSAGQQIAVTGGGSTIHYYTIHLYIYTSIYIYTSMPGQVSSSTFASSRAECSYWGGSTLHYYTSKHLYIYIHLYIYAWAGQQLHFCQFQGRLQLLGGQHSWQSQTRPPQ